MLTRLTDLIDSHGSHTFAVLIINIVDVLRQSLVQALCLPASSPSTGSSTAALQPRVN